MVGIAQGSKMARRWFVVAREMRGRWKGQKREGGAVRRSDGAALPLVVYLIMNQGMK
jgi:hypothetical protein